MIKVTLGEQPKEERGFPKVMKSEFGAIVHFVGHGVGTFITSEEGSRDALTLTDNDKKNVHWPMMDLFKDYNVAITIQNA